MFGSDACSENWVQRTKDTGKRIYEKMFNEHPRILEEFGYCKGKRKKEVNLKLCFESDLDFLRVPVEFLCHDAVLGDYLALRHPISRRLVGVKPQNPPLSADFLNNLWRNKEDLKILLIASNADETAPLQNVDLEIKDLEEDLMVYLKLKGIPFQIKTIYSKEADFGYINEILEKCQFHILHYAGHGFYKENIPDNSYLPFWSKKNCEGEVMRLTISELGRSLIDSNLRFVYLNCCSGGITSDQKRLQSNSFPGLAVGIIKAGVPAVLGFRCEISEASATRFAKHFYKSLLMHGCLDTALYNARYEMSKTNDQIWISSVLIVQG